MGTSADLHVVSNGKRVVLHTSYDGTFGNLARAMVPTLVAAGMDAVRDAFAKAQVIPDEGEDDGRLESAFREGVDAYARATRQRGKEAVFLEMALSDAMKQNPYYVGAIGLMSPLLADFGADDGAEHVLDLDLGTLTFYDGDWDENGWKQGEARAVIDLGAFEHLDPAAVEACGPEMFDFDHDNSAEDNARRVERWLKESAQPAAPADGRDAGHGAFDFFSDGDDAVGGPATTLTVSAHVSFVAHLIVAEVALADAWAHLPTLRQSTQLFPPQAGEHPEREPIGLRVALPQGVKSEELHQVLRELSGRLGDMMPGFLIETRGDGSHSMRGNGFASVSIGFGDIDDCGFGRTQRTPFAGKQGPMLRTTAERIAQATPTQHPGLWLLGVARIDTDILNALPDGYAPPADMGLEGAVPELATTARLLDAYLDAGARVKRWMALDDAARARLGPLLGPAELTLLEDQAQRAARQPKSSPTF